MCLRRAARSRPCNPIFMFVPASAQRLARIQSGSFKPACCVAVFRARMIQLVLHTGRRVALRKCAFARAHARRAVTASWHLQACKTMFELFFFKGQRCLRHPGAQVQAPPTETTGFPSASVWAKRRKVETLKAVLPALTSIVFKKIIYIKWTAKLNLLWVWCIQI